MFAGQVVLTKIVEDDGPALDYQKYNFSLISFFPHALLPLSIWSRAGGADKNCRG